MTDKTDQSLHSRISFVMELEKLKAVLRKTKPTGLDRYENSAEHSWQTALTALVFLQGTDLDALRVVTMLLLHDVVEIDCGDVFVYDAKARDDIAEREQRAAQRIFALLPEPQASTYLKLWREFEAGETPEAKFAKAMDRVNPVLQNLSAGGQSWVENGISRQKVLAVNSRIADADPDLWNHLESEILAASFLKDE